MRGFFLAGKADKEASSGNRGRSLRVRGAPTKSKHGLQHMRISVTFSTPSGCDGVFQQHRLLIVTSLPSFFGKNVTTSIAPVPRFHPAATPRLNDATLLYGVTQKPSPQRGTVTPDIFRDLSSRCRHCGQPTRNFDSIGRRRGRRVPVNPEADGSGARASCVPRR